MRSVHTCMHVSSIRSGLPPSVHSVYVVLACICPSLGLCSLLQLLAAIQLFGANLDDYLHLLLPPIVKLFDAPEVPLPSRK